LQNDNPQQAIEVAQQKIVSRGKGHPEKNELILGGPAAPLEP